MSKKIVAMLMAVAMAFSLLPVTAFATGGTNGQAPVTKTASDKNLTMNKTVKPNKNGTYTVRLESYATGSVSTTQTPVPMDIVLVLDVSGSMGDKIASYDYRKTEETSWSVSDVYHDYYDWGGLHRTDVTYYAKIDDGYYPVSYHESGNWGSESYWLEANNKVLGRKVTNREWNQKIYAEPLYTYSKVPGTEITKLYAMKTAVNSFIDSVAAQKDGETPVAHRISIVKFSGEGKIVKELTDVSHSAELKSAVNSLKANGATAADYGMQKAQSVLKNRGDNPNPSIVIMFTDGEPNHGSGYRASVAGDTVQAAKGLKDGGTKVYTIGMFKDLQSFNADKVDTYMNGVSSNYPEAVEADNDSGVTLGERAEGNYYFKADNAGDLNQVFQTISQSTTVTSPLDASAVVVDNVPSNFALTEGSVKVYTADCTGKNDKGELTWKDTLEESDIIPTIPEEKNTDGSQTISTTGFDFSKNWCGLDSNNKATGKKLIIEFTIKCTNYGGTQPTNAGAYIKANADSTDRIIWVDDPEVPVTIELNETLGVNEEKRYDGRGIPILSALSDKANDLVDGINNAYVDMALTVTVGNDIYTYKIPAKATTGSWYQGDSTSPMSDGAIGDVKTSKDVNRSTSNEVDVYTYNFDLTLSDAAPNGAAAPAEYKDNNASFKITPRDVTVTAKDKSVVAGQLAPTYEADVTGTINSDPVNYTIFCDYAPGATGTEFNITPRGEAVQGNYNVTYRPGKLTVTAAPTGTLKVTKEVQGDDLTLKSLPGDFKITVTGPNNYDESFSLLETVGDSDKTVTWTISNLPAGEYTVSETGEKLENYTCEATYHAGTASDATVTVNNTAQNQPATDAQASQQVTVTENQTRTMTVTNTYTKNATVDLSQLIQKQLTLKDSSTLPDNTTFSVTVTPKTVNGQPVEKPKSISGSVTVSALKSGTQNGDTYTAPFIFGNDGTLSLSAGTYTYTVQENATSPISGMQYDSDTYTLTIKVENSKASVKYTTKEGTTPTEVSTTNPLTIQNTYQAPDLTVEKKTVSVAGEPVNNNNPVAHVGEQIIWSVTVTNKNSTPAHVTLTDAMAEGVYTDNECKTQATNVNWDAAAHSWTATVSGEVTYYVNYTVKEADISKGKIVNTIVMKNGDQEKIANSDPVSTWDTKQLKSAKKLNTSDYTTTVTLTLPTVNGNKEGTPETEVQPDPITAISNGSYVIDQIGNEFTFVPELTLKVINATTGKTEEYKGVQDTSNEHAYHFGTGTEDVVTYFPKTESAPAQFKWEIKQDIPAATTVTLSYKLQLTNPNKTAGTYGVEDLNGNGQIEQGKTPLYTNEKAALYVKENDQGKEIAVFPKPSVSYTIKSSSGSHSGGSRPSLNTKDHYGYIIGYPVDYYTGQPTTDQTKKPVRPEGKITRAEVATIYFRMLTDESRTKFWSQSSGYSDVKTGDWFNNAVSTLSKAGIIAGYEDGSFRPNGYITRAEFATIAARFFDVTYNGKDLFPDISGHWAKDYINQAANKGFVNGYEDGTFKPDRNITRAEAVTLVNRTLDRHPDKSHFTKDMLVWPDNMDQTKWYYADMQEATNSHTYQMKENSDKTKYENWTKTLPIRNWEALEKAWSNANSSQGNGNVV